MDEPKFTPSQKALTALHAPDQKNMGRIGMGQDAIEALAGLNGVTKRLRWWSPTLVPGPLQTRHYAEAAIRGRTPSLPEEEITDRAARRWFSSQTLFSRLHNRHTMDFAVVVVGEMAILQSVGGESVHASQLLHILKLMSDHPYLRIIVLPDDHGAASVEPFSLHVLTSGDVVGTFETLVGGWYTRAPEDLARLQSTFTDMMGGGYGPQESRQIIKEALSSCLERTTELSTSNRRTATPRTASMLPVPESGPSE